MTVKWHCAATLAGNPNGRRHYDIGGDDNSNVTLVYPSEDGDEDTLKRARLIAAAPDLLAALREILMIAEMTDKAPNCERIARQAIAKAEGLTENQQERRNHELINRRRERKPA